MCLALVKAQHGNNSEHGQFSQKRTSKTAATRPAGPLSGPQGCGRYHLEALDVCARARVYLRVCVPVCGVCACVHVLACLRSDAGAELATQKSLPASLWGQ